MYRSVSVRMEGTLAERERDSFSRTITSLGGRVVSWNVHAGSSRTYALCTLPEGYDAQELGRGASFRRADDPPLVVLEIFPRERERAAALAEALGGAGGPMGAVDVLRTGEGVLVEWDASRTTLSLLLDLVDATLERGPGRVIVPILPLDDAVLTATASDLLGDPTINVSRLIETYAGE